MTKMTFPTGVMVPLHPDIRLVKATTTNAVNDRSERRTETLSGPASPIGGHELADLTESLLTRNAAIMFPCLLNDVATRAISNSDQVPGGVQMSSTKTAKPDRVNYSLDGRPHLGKGTIST